MKRNDLRYDVETDSGERYYPDHSCSPTVHDHLDRYRFAQELLQANLICLDAACGSGYGTSMLGSKVKKAIGLDCSEHAVQYAMRNYGGPNVDYVRADLNRPLPLDDGCVGAIISFETLEHVLNQAGMLGEFRRILRDDGLLIISTPNRRLREALNTPPNLYHIKELTESEFFDMLAHSSFEVRGLFGQWHYSPGPRLVSAGKSVVRKLAFSIRDSLKHSGVFQFFRRVSRHTGLTRLLYGFLAESAYRRITPIRLAEVSSYSTLIAICAKSGDH